MVGARKEMGARKKEMAVVGARIKGVAVGVVGVVVVVTTRKNGVAAAVVMTG
jgi:hypothetical protein